MLYRRHIHHQGVNMSYTEEFSGKNKYDYASSAWKLCDIPDDAILQLIPTKYQWVIDDCFMKGVANNWVPFEVPMDKDYSDWKDLSEAEQRCLCFNFGFFSSAEGLIANNLVRTLYHKINIPEMRLYFLRQMYEEGIHALTFAHISESLPINQDLIFNMHRNVDFIQKKDAFSAELISIEAVKNADLKTVEGRQILVSNLIAFYLIMEGIFFYGGFPQMLSFGKRKMMIGTTKQIEFILRDESIHIHFGTQLINTIMQEYPDTRTEEFEELIRIYVSHAVTLEKECVEYACKVPLTNLAHKDVHRHVEWVADKRLQGIGFEPIYKVDSTPLQWLSEITDLTRESNFFESTVKNYRMDGLRFSA
ncbi:MAG: ribonucleotide-diphosphate reductase subunit beta [Paraclostridium sp.]